MELYCEMGNLLFEKYYRGNLRRARATAGKQLSLSGSQLETTPFKALFPAKFFGIVTRGVLSEIDSVQQKNGFDWLFLPRSHLAMVTTKLALYSLY